ncbi:MAG: NUDIX domain-containing protein [Bacteroidales bacterium]|nr:NUDIX domain-containing protein [Bacteroidales bacterium]
MHPCHPAFRFRFCPFCGGSRFEWEGSKSHRCADCGHRFYTNPATAVIALLENGKGEILFVRRRFDPAKGTLDLPGGFVDCGERAEEAVAREVREETGLTVTESRFLMTLPNTYLFDELLYFTTDLVFRCKVEDWGALAAGDDAAECCLLPLAAVHPEEIGLGSIRRLVELLRLGQA